MTKIRIESSQWELIREVEVTAGKRLLSQLEKAGVEIPNACRTGMCAACLCTIESGGEYIQKDLWGEPAFPLWEDEVMTCIAGVSETEDTVVLRTI